MKKMKYSAKAGSKKMPPALMKAMEKKKGMKMSTKKGMKMSAFAAGSGPSKGLTGINGLKPDTKKAKKK